MDSDYIEISPTITCPTCNGKKYVLKGNQPVYMALIPATDERLKPPRICVKVTLAVLVTLCISSCIIYFLITRNISLSSNSENIVPYSVTIHQATNTLQLFFKKVFNVTNKNFFPLYLSNINAYATIDGKTKQIFNKSVSHVINMRSIKEIGFNVTINFIDEEMCFRCTTEFMIHKLYFFFGIEVIGTVMGQSLQSSLSVSQSANCGVNSTS